jgi:hypothetical protein
MKAIHFLRFFIVVPFALPQARRQRSRGLLALLACGILTLLTIQSRANSITLELFVPQYGGDGNASVNGFVGTTNGTIERLQWEWGDGTTNDSWFPAGHQYEANGAYLIQVMAFSTASETLTKTVTATITNVTGPPVILSQPHSVAVTNGARVSFNVSISGGSPLFYQWLFNGTHLTDGGDVSGSATNDLVISHVTTKDVGSYSVIITNAWGRATSWVAAVTIANSSLNFAHSSLGQWQSLGPYEIPQGSGPSGAGELQAFAVDFANPQIMYAGGGGGGPASQASVFKSTDAGNTWSNANTGLTDRSINVFWFDQTNPNILLVGTWFDGIFRSTDAAGHWIQVTNFGTTTAFVYRGQALYAATASGVAESDDLGATWSLVEPTSSPVRGLAASGTVLYAGLADGDVLFQASPSSSWQLVLSDSGRYAGSLAADPTSPQTAYVVEWANYYPDLFATYDAGSNWTQLYPQNNNTNQFNNAAQDVVVDGAGTVYASFDGSLYVSTDHGTNWVNVPGAGWDIRLIITWPGQPEQFVLGSDQGLFMTSDGGTNWTGLNGNIKSSLLTGLAVNGSTILTAVQDYGPLASYDGGASWQSFSGCEDGEVRFNPGNPNFAYAYTTCGFQYSADGGHTFNSVSAINFTFNGGHNMICVDAMNPSTVYVVANNGIFQSTNWGVSWTQPTWASTIRNPSLVVVSPNDSQTIYVGSKGPLLQVTHNGGATWALCNLGGANGYPYALDVDPSDPNIVEVGMTYPPSAGGGVLLSTNGGITFYSYNAGLNAISASLAGNYISTLLFSAISTNGMAALATASGVYMSATPGAPWTDISGNAIPKQLTDLAWVGGDLYATTYGEGVIRLANAGFPFLDTGSSSLTPNGFSSVLHGLIGANYVIKASSDLTNWQTITNIITTNALFYFTDPTATNYSRRFYRAAFP